VRRTRDRGIDGFRAGILALVVIGLFTYFGFSKQNPFANPYELHAVFDSANRLKERSPVRIAGVNVGKVTKVEPLEDGSGKARVTMEISDTGLPIKKDAELKIRSRLFLEGNYFVDLHPGRPDSPEIDSGSTIGPNQTAAPVQYLQVLTALQSETRQDLQRLLKEYSNALRGPGARGFNQAIKHWEAAWRDTSQVNDAYLGHGPHDLTRVLDGQSRVYGALSSNEEALKDLITGLNDTMSGFARQEDNLRAAIPELRDVLREGRPALASLNSALPEIRAFARDALPGARSSKATLDAQIPFIRQARRLMSEPELRGLAARLRAAMPYMVRLNQGTTLTLEQNRALASCQNNVLLPFAKTPIPDPDFDWHTDEPWYEESPRAFVGLSGESRIADANSPMFRVLGGGGPSTIVSTPETMDGPVYGQTLVPLDGVRPVGPSKRSPFRPDVPCETQDVPDLNAPGGPADESVRASADRPPTAEERTNRERAYEQLREFVERSRAGKAALDPFTWFDEGRKLQAKRLGIKP
jgi:phospholipid/cholesterol/gamma-HCH transport system substrate-binding protein